MPRFNCTYIPRLGCTIHLKKDFTDLPFLVLNARRMLIKLRDEIVIWFRRYFIQIQEIFYSCLDMEKSRDNSRAG